MSISTSTMRSRRKFFGACSATVAAFAIAPCIFSFSTGNRGTTRPGKYPGYAAFAAQINTPFRVQSANGHAVNLQLIKCRPASHRPVAFGRRPALDAGNEKFSLIFTGPVDGPLPPAIHSFAHPELGKFEIYIGEISAREKNLIRYEAVFNQPAAMALNRVEPG